MCPSCGHIIGKTKGNILFPRRIWVHTRKYPCIDKELLRNFLANTFLLVTHLVEKSDVDFVLIVHTAA
jgi:hypothetical protein